MMSALGFLSGRGYIGVKLSDKFLKKWVFICLCFFSIVLMLPQAGRLSSLFRHAVHGVLVPASLPGRYVVVHLRTRLDEMTASASPREVEKTEALRRQMFMMQRTIDYQHRQIQTLAKWDGVLEGFRCSLLPACVLYAEPSVLRNRLVVGAGSSRGVVGGDLVTTRLVIHDSPSPLPDKLVVLGQNYVVGCIADSSQFSATLVLVTDPHFKMPGKLWRMVEPGQKRTIYLTSPSGEISSRIFVHSGSGSAAEPVGNAILVEVEGSGCEVFLRHVPANHGIRAGDVLTSDDSTGLLSAGPWIGRATRIERDKNDAHFVTVFVEPFADLHNLRDVYIVLPRQGTDK